MRKRLSFALLMLFLPIMGALAQSKFAHLNSQDIISEMREYKVATATLADMQKKYQDELNRTKEDFNKKYQEYLAQAEGLPRNIAERRQKELQDLAQRQEQFQQDAYNSLQQAQQEAMNPILEKVQKAVQEIGEAEGYIYIDPITGADISPFKNYLMTANLHLAKGVNYIYTWDELRSYYDQKIKEYRNAAKKSDSQPNNVAESARSRPASRKRNVTGTAGSIEKKPIEKEEPRPQNINRPQGRTRNITGKAGPIQKKAR